MSTENYFQIFKTSIVRIYATNGVVVGAGFLVSSQYVITCAHVIAQVLNIPQTTTNIPPGSITLDFPLISPGQKVLAQVVFWRPVQSVSDISLNDGEDIAGLKLENIPPHVNKTVQLISSKDLWNHEFRVLGFPSGHKDGVWADGLLREELGNGWVQLGSENVPGYRIEPGFSGAPVWSKSLEGVVGMIVAAEKQREEVKSAFMIPTRILSGAWSQISQSPQTIAEYRVEAETFIYLSYGRSGRIDSRCEETLKLLRERLNLSKEETQSIENEIFLCFQNACNKIYCDVQTFEQQVRTVFQDESSSNYFDAEEREILEERQTATGIKQKVAGLTITLLGYSSLESGNVEKATKLFNEAIAYNSENASAYSGLGAISLKQADFKEAIKSFKHAKRLYSAEKGKANQVRELEERIQLVERMKRKSLWINFGRVLFPIPFTDILKSIFLKRP